MKFTRCAASCHGDLADLGLHPKLGHGSYRRAQGFHRNGGDAEPGSRIFPQSRFQNRGQLAAAAANKDRIRGGQLGQNLRGAPMCQLQIVDSKLFPVGPDKRTGLAPAFHRAHGAVGSQQGQLHRYRTGACPHIPVGLAVPHRQLSDGGGPDLLLGHGDVAPQENLVG